MEFDDDDGLPEEDTRQEELRIASGFGGDLSDEEVRELSNLGYGYPKPEEKNNVFTFFKRVIFMSDTSRTANLTNDELGAVRIPVRTNQDLSLFCNSMGVRGLGTYFKNKSMITTHTSLSREGFLDKLAVTQKKESDLKTRRSMTSNKGWFKKKETEVNY